MTLGLGASTAMFSVIDGVLLRPLPAKEPQRIVQLYQSYESVDRGRLSMMDVLDWRRHVHSLASLAIYRVDLTNVTEGESPLMVRALNCDPALLKVLGVAPARGRGFADDDTQPDRQFEVLLTWEFWKNRYGGDESIVGRRILLDQIAYQVIGILPEGFQLAGESKTSLWRPLPFDFKNPRNERAIHAYRGIGRLAAGVTLGQANGELASMQAELVRQYPRDDVGTKAFCVPWREAVSGDVGTALWLLFGSVGCVLLIACGNTANLLLVRAAARQNEMSIRIALGATRMQIIRQLLVESLMLSMTAAALALGFAWVAIRVIRSLPETRIPNSSQILLDWRIVLFAASMGLLTGVLFGLAPAWRVSSNLVNEALKQTSGRSTETRAQRNFRAGLVSVEAALAVLLAVGSGLLIHSFLEIARVNPGFNPKNVVTLGLSLTSSPYGAAGAVTRFVNNVLEKVRVLPGVEDAAFSSSVPLGITSGSGPVQIEGEEENNDLHSPQVVFSYVTPGYFRTMEIALIAGRDFDDRDSAHAPPVAIVNQAFVRELLHGGKAVGRRTRYYLYKDWREIVGVVGDVPQESFERDIEPQVYIPNAQVEDVWTTLVVRVRGDPKHMERAVKQKMAEVDPTVPAFPGRHTMADVIALSLGWRSFSTSILMIFAAIAILLASVGIYAVIAYSVAQRTSEIGLRMALGAQRSQILLMVLWQGVTPAALGALVGAVVAMGACQWLHSMLFRVSTLDAWAYATSVVLVIGVAAAASVGPALRAAAVDPNRALRDQ
jgi:putative ABC transport system permease protein